jgi:anti-sigma regulatory factor (Ser/Thr protein kinase)
MTPSGGQRQRDGRGAGQVPGGRPPDVSDRDAMLTARVSCMLSDLGASAVSAYLYDTPSRSLVAVAAAVTPLGTGAVERMPVDDSTFASTSAYRTGEIVTAHSVQEIGSHPELAVFAPFPFTVSSVPLGSADRPLGAIATYWPQMYRELPDKERAYLLEAGAATTLGLLRLAERGVSMAPSSVPHVITAEPGESALALATAVSRAKPAERFSMAAPLVYHLHKLANTLAGTVNTEEAAELALDRVTNGFTARAMVITLTEGDRLRVVGARGCSREFLRDLDGRPLGRPSLETEVVKRMRPIVQEPPLGGESGPETFGDGDDLGQVARAERARCVWAVLPLMAGGHAIGSCSIGLSPDRMRVMDEDTVLTALATVLSQTFERTRLYDARRALARKLQQALLPGMLPQFAGVATTSRYVPTSGGIDLGGDWYDLISLPDGSIGAVIGDVQGHNISAAIVMGQLRSAVRAYAAEGHDPGTVLSRTNRLLVELDTDRFATCCCVWLDPNSGIARIVSAGHHLPLVRFTDGHYHALTAENVGIPLGIEPDVRYRAATVALEPRTLVALYTDGLVGSDDPDDRMMRSVLNEAVTGSGEELETLGDLLIDGIPDRPARADDAALLLLRYEGPSAEARLHIRRLAIHRRDLQGVGRARQFLRDWLHHVELDPICEQAELLVSEVVTNALVHGDTDVDMHVRRYPGHVRVEVRDSDPHLALPASASPDGEAEGGRGLVIVAALASAWGNSPSGRGKTVWFELPVPGGNGDRRHGGR